jgi:CHASE3 domain sensor protein
MIIFLIILFILVVILAVSLWEYKKEKDRTMRIIASIPFLALIISLFKKDD